MSTLPTPKHFDFSVHDRVGIISLNRPERFNALTFEVYRELTDFIIELTKKVAFDATSFEARALLIRGEGKAFCSGGDVEDIIGKLFERDAEGLLQFTRLTGELIKQIRLCPLPVVVSIKRIAAGAGAVIALASDLRIMGKSSKFAFLFPQVGLCGADMGAAWLLPRIVGLGHASEILLEGEKIPASRCYEIGLANALVDDADPDAVDQVAFDRAKKLADGPAFATRMTKAMMQRELEMGVGESIEAEAQAQALCMQHPDFSEAHKAWKEKRKPRWQ